MKFCTLSLLLLLSIFSMAHAFDLGGLVKEITKEPAAEPGQEDAPKQSGLLGMLGETPVEEEVAIGREITGRLLGAAPLVADRQLQSYINKVGAWVAQQSGRSDIDWHFGVIASEDINAFAAPGGYILITRGLYRKLNNEAELAGVLAHEVGHVIKKHHLKLLKQGRLIEMGGSLLKQQAGDSERGRMIGKMIGSGAEVLARGLDKQAEYEADRIGVVLSARAGYDPYGLPSVLQDIGHLSADDTAVALLFKTHPHPEHRLVELSSAMERKAEQFEGGRSVAERFYRLE